MSLTVNRIYKNSSGTEIRIDEIIMVPKRNTVTFMFSREKHIRYERKINTTVLDVASNMTIATIDLIGNYTSRDTSADRDWCEWEIPTDEIISGTRQTYTVRCNMSDLKDVGETAL